MAETFLSLADYAKRKGLTEAEALKKLNSPKYRKYVNHNGGNVLVSFGIFEADRPAPAPREEDKRSPAEAVNNPAPAPDEAEAEAKSPAPADDEIDRLRKEVEELKKAVSEKDKQIADFALKFAELAQQAQQIAGQAQVLHLSEKAGTREIEAPQTEEEAPPIVPAPFVDEVKPAPAEKQGFWSRLFRKR